MALIGVGLIIAPEKAVIRKNLFNFWVPRGVVQVRPDLGFLPSVTATAGFLGLAVAFCVSQVAP